ncbi:type II toxin-antitoxin system CcdA family antitoxin [Sphingomonas glacialis]|uniref:Post-segregation antitoxin CcdA n=1 Tax=Sphingomonas glacialis TaxID=658225 RepID=A0A502FL01_9SPHN|nr:type II toxin-antitoxin system CcdA family antitoxin [Sphingomonas glacialis]TPG49763.1 post-segregation antitoxin CcdA [Sphingomonas glacialis]
MAARSTRREEAPAVRRATNISLDTKLVEAAKAYGINVSRACEEGLAKQVSDERSRRWQEENRGAIDAYNAWIEENGIPLAEHRMF